MAMANNPEQTTDTPARSVYVHIRPSTKRYKSLMDLARLYGVSYHTIALNAIDWYINTQTRPTKPLKHG